MHVPRKQKWIWILLALKREWENTWLNALIANALVESWYFNRSWKAAYLLPCLQFSASKTVENSYLALSLFSFWKSLTRNHCQRRIKKPANDLLSGGMTGIQCYERLKNKTWWYKLQKWDATRDEEIGFTRDNAEGFFFFSRPLQRAPGKSGKSLTRREHVTNTWKENCCPEDTRVTQKTSGGKQYDNNCNSIIELWTIVKVRMHYEKTLKSELTVGNSGKIAISR